MKLYKVDNAVIMAAGLSSRFAPLSYEYPKALLEVKGEILIERQIKQLKEAGIQDITIVVGYKKELFDYLIEKFQVKIIENSEYNIKNNHSTLYAVKDLLKNTYICSADNYFTKNVFELSVDNSYYSSVFEEGETDEWCLDTDENGLIKGTSIGGRDCWVMLGHVFFSEEFSKKFVEILESIYDLEETADLLWESIYMNNIDVLDMYIRKYPRDVIFEFDTLDELREFDESYIDSSGSKILQNICKKLKCKEKDITRIKPVSKIKETVGFTLIVKGKTYSYDYKSEQLREQ